MGQPRFQAYSRGAGRVEWRLIGGNNWELGRSAIARADFAAALADIERLRRGVDDSTDVVVRTGAGSCWRWRLVFEDEVVAVSSRGFLRRAACRDTLRQFLALAPTADLPSAVRRFG